MCESWPLEFSQNLPKIDLILTRWLLFRTHRKDTYLDTFKSTRSKTYKSLTQRSQGEMRELAASRKKMVKLFPRLLRSNAPKGCSILHSQKAGERKNRFTDASVVLYKKSGTPRKRWWWNKTTFGIISLDMMEFFHVCSFRFICTYTHTHFSVFCLWSVDGRAVVKRIKVQCCYFHSLFCDAGAFLKHYGCNLC